jgi:membrane-bound inhibitor of C-type lysozyme
MKTNHKGNSKNILKSKENIILFFMVYLVTFFLGFYIGKTYQESIFEKEATPIASAIFQCSDNKFIVSDFFENNVELRLSDNRLIIIPRAISASGARYADKKEVFVFWNKGNTAFIEENGTTTFEDCIANGSSKN